VRVRRRGASHSFASPPGAIPIPDASPEGIISDIVVDQPSEILGVRVSLRIQHTFIGDLWVALRAPNGQLFPLHEYEGGDIEDLNLTVSGLPGLAIQDPRGTWSLLVVDDVPFDEGSLLEWSLEIVAPAPLPADGFAQWIDTFPGLSTVDRGPGADPDGDGIPNAIEYALVDGDPTTAGIRPSLEMATGIDEYLEFTLDWRAGIDAQAFQVFLCEDLASGGWAEAADRGAEIIVDRTNPARLLVRLHRSLPRAFLQLRTAADAGF
jgi:subtilisin-like proprotein convertase family protein